jgi:hypothetical protein
MADPRNTEKEIDYRKPTRINRNVRKTEKKQAAAPHRRSEAYHRERFDTRRAIDLMDDDEF